MPSYSGLFATSIGSTTKARRKNDQLNGGKGLKCAEGVPFSAPKGPTMNRGRSILWLISSIGILACACDKGNDAKPSPAPSASVAAQAAPSAPTPAPPSTDQAHGERGPGHGGVDSVLFRAAHDLDLSDDQDAKLASLQADLHDRDTAPRDAMRSFASNLAAQVAGGKIDASKFQPDEAALDDAMKSMLDKQAVALNGLHETLDATQRKALADAVRAKAAALKAHAKMTEVDASDWVARRLDHLTTDLGLDATQQQQVAALLAKQPAPTAERDEVKKQVAAVVTAFAVDPFDAAKVLKANTKTPHEAMDRQITFTKQLLAILQPDQRAKLAAGMTRPMRRGPGPGGGEPTPE
jgi:Spy/CpxP family protein refolding chaperone